MLIEPVHVEYHSTLDSLFSGCFVLCRIFYDVPNVVQIWVAGSALTLYSIAIISTIELYYRQLTFGTVTKNKGTLKPVWWP